MALEMQVYREIKAYEAKVIAGMSWRQLLALLAGLPLLALVSYLLWFNARGWIASVDFVVFIPFAAYGWWRPRGLKPESFVGYLLNAAVAPKELTYEPVAHPSRPSKQAHKGQGRRAVARTVYALEHGQHVPLEDRGVFVEEVEEPEAEGPEAQEGSGERRTEPLAV